MEHIIRYLKSNGITDPEQIHSVSRIIVDAMNDSSVRSAAEEMSRMDSSKLKLVIQQVLGGG